MSQTMRRLDEPQPDDAARCGALARYNVLDTTAERAFDRIVNLAAVLLDVPIALISLVDAKRQWFKARYGLDAAETPRTIAFCDHAIRGQSVFVVPDAERDPRFQNNPLVTGAPHVRFYAGAPLRTSDGFAIGTICAIDRSPRDLGPREAAVMEHLAEQVVHEMEVRLALGDIYREVAEGRRTARTLQGEGARLEALLNATGNAVVTLDAAGRVAAINRIGEAMFGLGPDEALGWPTQRLTSIELRPQRGAGPDRPTEGRAWRRNGTEFPIELSRASWTDADGRQACGAILRDISSRRSGELEQRRRDSAERTMEKLAGLGRVAGGVAHEMNNLLQPVIGLTELELENCPAGGTAAQSESRENLEMVLDCGRQMREIVKKILIFARKDRPETVVMDFGAALWRTVRFVRNLLPAGVRIETGDDQGLEGHASIHESGLVEVITNLCINAAHAMNNVGVVTIRLGRSALADEAAATLGVQPGAFFTVAVSDTGHGMDAATKSQVFDPFFTTKPIGRGTGLGLSMVFGVLRGWHGAVAIDSTLGRGSTFTLYVPVAV